MKKRTDTQLFRELRITNFIFGTAMIIVAIVTFFLEESLGDYFYEMVLFFLGLLLLSYAGQKYFQEHPKVRIALMWILIILALLGAIVFFMYMKSI